MKENEVSYQIRGAIYKVYNKLGPGLLESIYEKALAYELRKAGLQVVTQQELQVIYDGEDLGVGLRLDLLVEDCVIVEIKSKEELTKVDHKQLITYLKVTDIRLGILVNFHVDEINDGIFRKVNRLPFNSWNENDSEQ
jgi:GxxExxY protein